jgi:hypothetical protein
MSIVLQSSSGGSITINEPATSSNFTQTLPAASGEVMVSGNQPAFSAYQSTQQVVANATATKITFTTSEFDTTSGMYASSRFTPTIAGYYYISASVSFDGGAGSIYVQTAIYKNGLQFKSVAIVNIYNAAPFIGALIYLNGSTDYVEIYGTQSSGISLNTTSAGQQLTYFQGYLARTA